MREVISDASAVRNIDMLLQYVEESEDGENVGRISATWRNAMQSKQNARTAREITM